MKIIKFLTLVLAMLTASSTCAQPQTEAYNKRNQKLKTIGLISLAIPSIGTTCALAWFTTATTYLQIKSGMHSIPGKVGMGIIVGILWPLTIGSGFLSKYLIEKARESAKPVTKEKVNFASKINRPWN